MGQTMTKVDAHLREQVRLVIETRALRYRINNNGKDFYAYHTNHCQFCRDL